MSKFDYLPHSKIDTKDVDGSDNGYLIPIYNEHETWHTMRPAQVYLTSVKPGCKKGPHLHYYRNGAFTCIRGNVMIVVKYGNEYREYKSGEDHEFATVFIPAGRPSMVVNIGDTDADVLNMPYKGYRKEDKDELIPKEWDYEPTF